MFSICSGNIVAETFNFSFKISTLLFLCLVLSFAQSAREDDINGLPHNLANSNGQPILLPNTSGINGELTANYSVDKFFSLWIVFNMEPVVVSEKPFTVLAPVNNASVQITEEKVRQYPEVVRKLLLDHMVLGQKLDLHIPADFSFTTLGGRTVNIRRYNGVLHANGAKVITEQVDVPKGRLVIVDNYLFPEDLTQDHSFLQDMTEVLSFLQSGVRVFQHLLARTNVTKLLSQGGTYTVLVPTDKGFQKWHPIDWGFYPFSVSEFTEYVLKNHFIKGNVRQQTIGDEQTVTTVGGNEIVFRKKDGILTANGIEIIKGDTPVTRGNIMFVPEVLFVNDSIVQQLHEKHRDKETPPLLALPWFDSQFLSHAYLALEHTPQFKHITRFLSKANIATLVPGYGYTFFVPIDKAFEDAGLAHVPDSYMSSGIPLNVLLSHFVNTRLYSQDLQNSTILTTVANTTLNIWKDKDNTFVGNATVLQKEVFVYNLGNMFFVDKIINVELLPPPPESNAVTTQMDNIPETEGVTANPDSEIIPNELSEETGSLPDSLLEENSSVPLTSRNIL